MTNYSYTQRNNGLDEIKNFFRQGSGLSTLILINIVVWAAMQVLKVLFFFFNDPGGVGSEALMMHVLALPASIPLLSATPWTLITYNFLHFDIWHILFNMAWLFWFGKIFLEFLSSRQLTWIYLLGGMAGGLFYLFAFNFFPVFTGVVNMSFALGASASVMAIVAAVSFYVPSYTIQLLFIGRLKIGYMAIILFVTDFFMIPSGNAGGHIAHLGGAGFGVIYIWIFKIYHKSYQPSAKANSAGSFGNWFKTRKQEKEPSSGTWQRPVSDDDYNKKRKENQRKTDEILEKISKGGYDSLTREEKDFLFNASNKR